MALKFTVPLVASKFSNEVSVVSVALVACEVPDQILCSSVSIFVIFHHENVYHTIDGWLTVKS